MVLSIFILLVYLTFFISGFLSYRDDEDFEFQVNKKRSVFEERGEMELDVIIELPDILYQYYDERILWSDETHLHGSGGILMHEDTAIITRYNNMIHLLNISILDEISVISTFEFEVQGNGCEIERIVLSFPYLFIARDRCGLSILNISNISFPQIINSNDSFIIPVVQDLCVLEDVLIVIGYEEFVDEQEYVTIREPVSQFINVKEENNLTLLFRISHDDHSPISVSCVNDFVSITWEDYGFEILKIEFENETMTPKTIYESEHVEISHRSYVDVFYVGERYVYVSGNSLNPPHSGTTLFYVFDRKLERHDPLSVYDTRIECYGKSRPIVAGELSFFGCHGSYNSWEEYIPYFDISERRNPKIAGYLGEDEEEKKILYLRELALQGNIAFVTTGGGLFVLRIGDLFVGNNAQKMCQSSCSECYAADSDYSIKYDHIIVYNETYKTTRSKTITVFLTHPSCYDEGVLLEILQILYVSGHLLLFCCVFCTVVSVVCILFVLLWNSVTSCCWWVSCFSISLITQGADPDGEGYDQMAPPIVQCLTFLFFLFLLLTVLLFFSQLGVLILSPVICFMSIFVSFFLILMSPFFVPLACQFCFVFPAFACLCCCSKMVENMFKSLAPNLDDWVEILENEEEEDDVIFRRIGFRDHGSNNNGTKEDAEMEDLEVVGMRSTSFKDAPEKSKEEEEEVSCSICLEPFKPSDECIILGCHVTHIFHTSCINKSLSTSSNYCPLCRKFIDTVDCRPFDPSVDFCVIRGRRRKRRN